MFEQIADLVKQYGRDSVIDNPAVPNQQNNAVLEEATQTITGGMQNMLAGGGLQDIISMFTGSNNDAVTNRTSAGGGLLKNPVMTMMIGHLISKLVTKFNMNRNDASHVANNLIPNVLNGLVTKTNDTDPSNDAFDLNDLISSLTGGRSAAGTQGGGFNFQDLLRQFTGGGGNGGFDLQDIIQQVTNGAQESQEEQASKRGGIGDLIKGFFS